jgi:hypothetical protein
VHKPSACFFDLREGCDRGVIDAATTGTWLGQQVTFLTVDDGPFETFMVSNTISGPNVYVQLGSDSVREIGADQPADTAYPANGFKRLILQGTGYTGAAAGQWYTIKGNCTTEDIARCGSWSAPASHNGGATTFALSSFAEVRDEQIGWWLQPNINCQAWFPIIAVSESAHTVTVAGNHAALGAQGTRFRIHAPPGVQTRGSIAGLLPMFAEAASSRCLYKGYRYETAAAGRWTSQGIAARQGGKNFTGQHYTLFRHFDPSLMRFTSLDPIAASQNLWAYCDNNPHGAYDPDGLSLLILADYLFNDGQLTKLAWEKFKAGGARALDAIVSFPGQDLGRGSDLSSLSWQNTLYVDEAGGAADQEAQLYGYGPYDSPFEKYAKRRDHDAAAIRTSYVDAGGSPLLADTVGTLASLSGYVVTTAAVLYLTSGLPLQHASRAISSFEASRGYPIWRAGGRANILFNYEYGRLETFGALGGLPRIRYRPPVRMIGGYPEGSFSIINWQGYPTVGNVPKPTGPFRLLQDAEYAAARASADTANRALHIANPQWGGMQLHEIHPVKFGGSPVDPANKIVLPELYTNSTIHGGCDFKNAWEVER